MIVKTQKFAGRLAALLENFDVQAAEALCVEMHEVEGTGYDMGHHEDRLWMKLTEKLVDYWHEEKSHENENAIV